MGRASCGLLLALARAWSSDNNRVEASRNESTTFSGSRWSPAGTVAWCDPMMCRVRRGAPEGGELKGAKLDSRGGWGMEKVKRGKTPGKDCHRTPIPTPAELRVGVPKKKQCHEMLGCSPVDPPLETNRLVTCGAEGENKKDFVSVCHTEYSCRGIIDRCLGLPIMPLCCAWCCYRQSTTGDSQIHAHTSTFSFRRPVLNNPENSTLIRYSD